jgi:hypothetical protein
MQRLGLEQTYLFVHVWQVGLLSLWIHVVNELNGISNK